MLVAWVLGALSAFRSGGFSTRWSILPFALPTAVAGIALTALYAPNGLARRPLAALGIHVAFTRLGHRRRADLHRPAVRRAYRAAGAGRSRQRARRGGSDPRRRALADVYARDLPAILPAALTGFALAFARGVGEYGSVIFIAGNMPMRTEIAPLLIVTKLEQYRLRRRHGDRGGDAGGLVRAAAGDQRAAATGAADAGA